MAGLLVRIDPFPWGEWFILRGEETSFLPEDSLFFNPGIKSVIFARAPRTNSVTSAVYMRAGRRVYTYLWYREGIYRGVHHLPTTLGIPTLPYPPGIPTLPYPPGIPTHHGPSSLPTMVLGSLPTMGDWLSGHGRLALRPWENGSHPRENGSNPRENGSNPRRNRE